MSIADLNFLAVLVSAVASFALGAIWYSPALFANPWMKAVGFSEDNPPGGNMAKTFGLSFVMIFIMVTGLALVLLTHGGQPMTALVGMKHGFFLGVVFVGTSTAINYLYQQKPLYLWAIDAGYQILYLGLSGLILGAWR